MVSILLTMTQDALSLLQPFMDLIEDDFLREKVEDTARVYFTSPNFTVNLIPAIIIGLLLLIGLLKLLGLPILASFGLDGIGGSGDGGYGAPSGKSSLFCFGILYLHFFKEDMVLLHLVMDRPMQEEIILTQQLLICRNKSTNL